MSFEPVYDSSLTNLMRRKLSKLTAEVNHASSTIHWVPYSHHQVLTSTPLKVGS